MVRGPMAGVPGDTMEKATIGDVLTFVCFVAASQWCQHSSQQKRNILDPTTAALHSERWLGAIVL